MSFTWFLWNISILWNWPEHITESYSCGNDKHFQNILCRFLYKKSECWNIFQGNHILQSPTIQSSEKLVFLFPGILMSLLYAPTILPRNNYLTLNFLKQSAKWSGWSFGPLSFTVNTWRLLNPLLPLIWGASNPSDQTQSMATLISVGISGVFLSFPSRHYDRRFEKHSHIHQHLNTYTFCSPNHTSTSRRYILLQRSGSHNQA